MLFHNSELARTSIKATGMKRESLCRNKSGEQYVNYSNRWSKNTSYL